MKIYVVQGSTGEYSDHTEWLVKAFHSEAAAKDFVEKARAIAREIFQHNRHTQVPNPYYDPTKSWSSPTTTRRYTSEAIETHPMDPKFVEDYTGTNYAYYEVELE